MSDQQRFSGDNQVAEPGQSADGKQEVSNLPTLTSLLERTTPAQDLPLYRMPNLGAPPLAGEAPAAQPVLGPGEFSRLVTGAITRNMDGSNRPSGPVDVLRARQVADGRPAAADAPAPVSDRGRVVSVQYNDKDLDAKIKGSYDTLKIDGVPPTVKVSSWVDKEGKFFIWYLNGADNKKPHFVPDEVKTIEINGTARSLDEMRKEARDAVAKTADSIKYGDPKIVDKLGEANLQTLRISGVPSGVRMGSGLDQKGFYFYFTDGRENSTPFYIPSKLKSIEVNGVASSVDQMRISAAQEFAKANDRTKNSLRAVDGTENIWAFGNRMSGLSDQALGALVGGLNDAGKDSSDPTVHLLNTHYMTAAIIRPIVAGFDPKSERYNIDQKTKDAVDAAYKEAALTAQLARKERNFYVQMQAERLTYMLQFARGIVGLAASVPGGFELP